MKLTFATQKYMNEFMRWIDDNGYGYLVDSLEIEGSSGFAIVNITENMLGSITELFEAIILERAAMAKVPRELKEIFRIVVFQPMAERMRKIFENYIEENDHVNLEGFVTFRLEKYSAMVNIVLYAALKRMLY